AFTAQRREHSLVELRECVEHRGYFARASVTISTNLYASVESSSHLRAATRSFFTSAEPTPSAAAPALIHSAALFRSTPPVGVSFICGSGAWISRRYCGPKWLAGKTFTISAPAFQAARISVGDRAPGTATQS